MTGAKLKSNARPWQKLMALKTIRDQVAVHPKQTAYGISYRALARRIDDFKEGVALPLGQLHVHARYYIPEAVIKAYYYPDVQFVS